MRKPTIYEIKKLTKESAPYFFDKETMKFFNQRLKDFKVFSKDKGRFKISAPSHDFRGEYMGDTIRYFNPTTNELETKIP